jgi:hypothetical protein
MAHGGLRPALARQEPAARGRAHGRLGTHHGPVRRGDRGGDRGARTAPPGAAGLVDGGADLPRDGAALGRAPWRRDRLRGERAHRRARSALDAPSAGQRVGIRARMGARPDGAAEPARALARGVVGVFAGRIWPVLGRHPLLCAGVGRARTRRTHRHEEMPGGHAHGRIRLLPRFRAPPPRKSRARSSR